MLPERAAAADLVFPHPRLRFVDAERDVFAERQPILLARQTLVVEPVARFVEDAEEPVGKSVLVVPSGEPHIARAQARTERMRSNIQPARAEVESNGPRRVGAELLLGIDRKTARENGNIRPLCAVGNLLRQFELGINRTLVRPLGTDTYATLPKEVPFILDRIFNVRWFWQFDYSELEAIVSNNVDATGAFIGRTEQEQRRRAAVVGARDFDLDIFNLFGTFLAPGIRFVEMLVGSVTSTQTAETTFLLYERYIECDYAGALQCRSDLGIGLFDAIANVLLIYAIIGVIVGVLLPSFAGVIVMFLIMPVLYFAVLWLAYGASPLCTLPSTICMIPGIPVCLPSDIYELIDETVPPCSPFIEPTLIPAGDPRVGQLCAACATSVPAQQPCDLAAGFFSGIDNIFYTSALLFNDSLNPLLASLFDVVSPDVAAVARTWTAARVDALGRLGRICNLRTSPNFVIGFLLITIFVALFLATVFLLASFVVAGFWLYFATLFAVGIMLRQIDRGFVQRARLDKEKIE